MSISTVTPSSDNCMICLDNLENEKIRTLKCDHIFHEACIGKWLNTAPTCPLCRLQVTDLTPMPRPPEMTLEEILAVPDYNPHPFGIHAQAIDENVRTMIALLTVRSSEEAVARVHEAAQAIINMHDLHMLIEPLDPIEPIEMTIRTRSRIRIRMHNSHIGHLFTRAGNFFRRIRER